MKTSSLLLLAGTVCLLSIGSAQAIDTLDNLQVSKPGDIDMSCGEISREVTYMEDVIADSEEIIDDTEMAHNGMNVAKAVGSYMVGSLGGAVGIMAATHFVMSATDGPAEEAGDIQDVAEQRLNFMAGVYNAKGCVGPLELATIEPAGGEEDTSHEAQEKLSASPSKPHYND